MVLSGFCIQMYKCVLDSGWIEVSPLMVLVGKNESGKTSLLKALHKLNPFKPEHIRWIESGHGGTEKSEMTARSFAPLALNSYKKRFRNSPR
jgi:ABC-type cobalamin/Fe3+-siderophores transport system ATPase subunit